MKRYAPISKVEDQPDGTLKVWGWCSSETMDADGDIILASAMAEAMPEFMKYGNIRQMHQNIAAGVAFEWEALPDGKTWIGTHIVDEDSIKKVKNKVLKGFSIGGNGTACDPDNPKVITALELSEISLVDRPANPDAVINLWKAKMEPTTAGAPLPSTLTISAETQAAIDELATMLNGGHIAPQELLVFAKAKKKKESGSAGAEGAAGTGTEPTAGTVKAAQTQEQNEEEDDATKTKAIDPGVANLPKVAKANGHTEGCSCEDCMGMDKAAKAAKVTTDATEEQKNADADEHGEMGEKFTKASDKAEPYGDVDYADPGYQEDGKKRYPLDTEKHIRAAWSYIGKEGNAAKYDSGQVSKIKARIVGAWKKTIDPKGPPSAKEKSMTTGTIVKASAVNESNGTAGAFPKKDDAVMFKDGEFTHTAKINEVKDGVASVNGENYEVTVSVSSLGINDSEANEGAVTWVTTMDQAHNWKFKQSNVENLDSGVEHYSNNGAKTAAAGGKQTLTKRYLEKGMYDIVDMAYVMCSINSLLTCMKYEEMSEDDAGSKGLAALKAWAEAGKHVMMAIVTEELGEMGSAEDLDIMEVLAEKSASSGVLQKGLQMFLQSAGDEAIASMHEFCAVKLAEAAPGAVLQKALSTGDNGALVKALTAQNQTVLDALEQANARIAKLEATPLGGPMLKGYGVSGQEGKEGDVTNAAGGVAPVMVPGTDKVDAAATAFKKGFKGGGQNLFGKVQH